MKLGVLETGPVPEELVARYGPYTDFFARMIHKVRPDAELKGWPVHLGSFPEGPDVVDGWIISGSKYGAYEDHAWIPPLEDFLRRCLDTRAPIAGFCFGHQILAQAAGGKVVKYEKGWGLGVHDYEMTTAKTWIEGAAATFSAHAVHQDQVVEKPRVANVIAQSDFCAFAALAYGDPGAPHAISIQPHPEFEPEFMRDLIDVRSGMAFAQDIAQDARNSLGKPVDNDAWAKWVVDFFETAIAARQRT